MNDWMEDVIQQTIDASRPGFANKAEAVEYYQDHYRGWAARLSRDLLPFAQKAKSAKSLQRRFNPDRIDKPEAANNAEYQRLAKSEGILKPPRAGYHVRYSGGILFSKCEQRDFEVDIVGGDALEVAEHPEHVVQIAIMIYMQMYGESDESIPAPCGEDGEPEVIVTANEPGHIPIRAKPHLPAVPFLKRRRA